MEIRIQTIHFDADKKLLDFVQGKVEKLATFYDRIVSVDVYLKFDSASSQIKEKTAELKVTIPGTTLFADESSSTFEDAVNKAVASLKTQIKKHKSKIMD